MKEGWKEGRRTKEGRTEGRRIKKGRKKRRINEGRMKDT